MRAQHPTCPNSASDNFKQAREPKGKLGLWDCASGHLASAATGWYPMRACAGVLLGVSYRFPPSTQLQPKRQGGYYFNEPSRAKLTICRVLVCCNIPCCNAAECYVLCKESDALDIFAPPASAGLPTASVPMVYYTTLSTSNDPIYCKICSIMSTQLFLPT